MVQSSDFVLLFPTRLLKVKKHLIEVSLKEEVVNIKPLVLGSVILGLACLVATPLLADFTVPNGNSSCDYRYAREKSGDKLQPR